MGTRWDEYNCFPQCAVCNTILGGRLEVYKSVLLDMYGEYVFDKLEKRARKRVNYSESDIDEMIERYRALLKGVSDY